MADGAAGEEIVATDLLINEPKKNRHDPVGAAPRIAGSHLLPFPPMAPEAEH